MYMQLVFIHGSGSTKEAFQYQIEHFDNAEAIDLPGHPDGEICTTVDAYADWLHNDLDRYQGKDIVLAGHSLGGGIALAYALKYSQSVKGVILIGSGLRLRVHPDFLNILEGAQEKPEQFKQMMGSFSQSLDPQLGEVMQQRLMENGPVVMLNDMRACDQFDVMGREKEFKVPILAICGTDDVMTPPKYSQFMAETIPNARAVIIEDGTHFVFAEKPDEVNRAIEGFLEQIQ
jgi:pimeloyl-ACP methyl ester carboxylesterase